MTNQYLFGNKQKTPLQQANHKLDSNDADENVSTEIV